MYFVLTISNDFLIEGAPEQKKIRYVRKPRRGDADPFKGVHIIMYIFIFIILAPVVTFIYNFVRDPETPTVINNLTDLISEKTFGYLSSGNNSTKTKKKMKKPLRNDDKFVEVEGGHDDYTERDTTL